MLLYTYVMTQLIALIVYAIQPTGGCDILLSFARYCFGFA